MKEFTVASFKFGLDTRKDVLSSQPGTLVTCENASINPGGEIEKRKTFDLFADVSALDDNASHDTGTFGIEVTSAGIVVFGSALTFGTTPSQSQPVLQSAMPAGITYQQLKHPSLTNDLTETYDRTLHRVTSIPFSENFNGNAFVAAKFADGRTFLYYNGTLIQQSTNGVVMEGRTALADLANDLLRQMQAIGWSGEANLNEYGGAQNGSALIKSPISDFFASILTVTSAAGYVGEKQIAQNGGSLLSVTSITRTGATATVTLANHGFSSTERIRISGANQTEYNISTAITNVTKDTFDYTVSGAPASPATGTIKASLDTVGAKAVAGFKITVNTGTFKLEAPVSEGSSTLIDLCGGAVAAVGSATATCAAIAAAVNDLTFVTGYSSQSNADSIFVYAPISWGVLVADLTVTVTTGTVAASGAAPGGLNATISPSPLTKTRHFSGSVAYTIGTAICTPSGGSGTYTQFTWSPASTGSEGIIVMGANGNASMVFQIIPPSAGTYTGSFRCVVTDSLGATGTAFLNVSATFTP